jgi:hypothetical protein
MCYIIIKMKYLKQVRLTVSFIGVLLQVFLFIFSFLLTLSFYYIIYQYGHSI